MSRNNPRLTPPQDVGAESDTITDLDDNEASIIGFASVSDEGRTRSTSPGRDVRPTHPPDGGAPFDAIMDIEREEASAIVFAAVVDEEEHLDFDSVVVSTAYQSIIP